MARRKVYLFVMAALVIVLAVLLSAAAVRTWQEGSGRKAENPREAVYTPENTAEQLTRLWPLLLAAAGLAAAGPLMGVRGGENTRPASVTETERDLLAFRLGEPGEGIREERKKQRIIRWARRAAFAACMVPVLIYCADRGHFPENDLEAMFAALVLHTAPWTAAGLLILLGGVLLEEKSMRREMAAARAQLKAGKGTRRAEAAGGTADRPIAAVRIVLLLAAGAMILLGALNGSLKDVLLKAINICTECIGLG